MILLSVTFDIKTLTELWTAVGKSPKWFSQMSWRFNLHSKLIPQSVAKTTDKLFVVVICQGIEGILSVLNLWGEVPCPVVDGSNKCKQFSCCYFIDLIWLSRHAFIRYKNVICISMATQTWYYHLIRFDNYNEHMIVAGR